MSIDFHNNLDFALLIFVHIHNKSAKRVISRVSAAGVKKHNVLRLSANTNQQIYQM